MSRLDALVERLVRWAVRETPFMRCYPATVQRTLDGAIEVLADDEAMRAVGCIAVPLTPIPGTTIDAASGQRCLLAFEAADPSRPRIVAWEGGQRGNRVGLAGGKRRIARMCDVIEVAAPPGPLPVTGSAQGTITVPGTPPVLVPVPPGSPFSGAIVLTIPLTGVVQGGHPKLLA